MTPGLRAVGSAKDPASYGLYDLRGDEDEELFLYIFVFSVSLEEVSEHWVLPRLGDTGYVVADFLPR
jgi:hypothetical protein